MAVLFSRHPAALNVLFADLERYALSQREAFIGTAGLVIERRNAGGFRFYAHQFYDGEGKQRERYVAGPVGEPEADFAAETLRTRIRELKEIVPSLRLLGREGFQLVDSRTYAVVAALHNQGLFRAGGMIVGSHAYGVLLNRLGVRAAGYATEDIDIARGRHLSFADSNPPTFLDMLKTSAIDFAEVPALHRKEPPTSFKRPGQATFRVNLLKAHATGVPHLAYLLAEAQSGALLAREGCSAVRVPLPERFAIHKIIVSAHRRSRDAKAQRDRLQAAVLCAALADLHPDALESAIDEIPQRARKHFHEGRNAVRDLLETSHSRAWEALHQKL